MKSVKKLINAKKKNRNYVYFIESGINKDLMKLVFSDIEIRNLKFSYMENIQIVSKDLDVIRKDFLEDKIEIDTPGFGLRIHYKDIKEITVFRRMDDKDYGSFEINLKTGESLRFRETKEKYSCNHILY